MLLVLSGEVFAPGDLGRLAGGIRTRARSGICSRPRRLKHPHDTVLVVCSPSLMVPKNQQWHH